MRGVMIAISLLIVAAGCQTTPEEQQAAGVEDRSKPGAKPGAKPVESPQVVKLDVTKLKAEAVKPFNLGAKEAVRCRNMWTLGLMLWMYGRDRAATIEWLQRKFAKKPEIAQANVAALNAGHAFGETAELSAPSYSVAPTTVLDNDIASAYVPTASGDPRRCLRRC